MAAELWRKRRKCEEKGAELSKLRAEHAGVLKIVLLINASVFGVDADVFLPERRLPEGVPRPGVSFGHGMHHCIGQELAVGVEEARGVQTTRLREAGLARLEPVGQPVKEFWGEAGRVLERWRVDEGVLDRGLAADTAAAARVEVAAQAVQVYGYAGREDDLNDIVLCLFGSRPAMAHRLHLIGTLDDALAGQETQGKLAVVARSAHHHRARDAAESDLERFLARDRVSTGCTRVVGVAAQGHLAGGVAQRSAPCRKARPPGGRSTALL